MIAIKSLYHIALNDIGLILQNVPESPAYAVEQAAIYSNRFAQGDRTYNDFAKWWYWAQTDWFSGLQDSLSWEDNAKYYYSTNIDAYSEVGAIKLAPAQILQNTFAENITCGGEFTVNGTTLKYIGTDDGADNRPNVYQLFNDIWTDILDAAIGTNQNILSQISARSGILWISTVGNGSTGVVMTWNGSAWVDQSANINTGAALTYAPSSSRCHVTVGESMYVFVDNGINYQYALVKTSAQAPSVAGDWTKVFERTLDGGMPISAIGYGGSILYLVSHSSWCELRKYDIVNNVDTQLQVFLNTNTNSYGVGDKYLSVIAGKLIITIPSKEIWQYDGADLVRIYKRDNNKANNIGTNETSGALYWGAVASNNKLWWGNLMYDGENFHNTWKPSDDSTANTVYPLFVDASDQLYQSESVNQKKLYRLSTSAPTAYKGTADKNFLVMSQFDKVSGVDKILYSATLIFKKLVSGQKIVLEYATGELNSSTTWTVLGNVNYTTDGGSVTSRVLFFPVNTTCKKVWYRPKLEGGGSDTPVLYDVVTAYLPIPEEDKQWRLNIDCSDNITLLNSSIETRKGREVKGKLESAWRLKQVLDFQDVDYADTQLNGSLTAAATTVTVDDTSEFPEVGRIRIDNEVIFYTGKTQTTFTGCLRGQRSTVAAAHSDNAAVNNGYKVLVQSFNAKVPILNNERRLEYIVGLSLREVI